MMPIRGQQLEMLKAVAAALDEDLIERLVFVGGCTTALFITDPVTLENVRAADDIDLIVSLVHEDADVVVPVVAASWLSSESSISARRREWVGWIVPATVGGGRLL